MFCALTLHRKCILFAHITLQHDILKMSKLLLSSCYMSVVPY
jgi:hypothetical protein